MAESKGIPTAGPTADEGLELVEMADPRAADLRAPVLDDVYVVYLGNMRNYSEAMVGRIVIDQYEKLDDRGDPVVDPQTHEPLYEIVTKETHEEGVQAYDFSSHNNRGQVIRSRHIRKGHPDVVGKPFCKVEHAEHVRKFMMRRVGNAPLFKVLATRASRVVLDAYISEKNRRLRVKRNSTEETVDGR